MDGFDYEPVENREIQDLMIEELDQDMRDGAPFPGRLTEHGRSTWRVMLYTAFRAGTSAALEAELSQPEVLAEREPSRSSKSGTKKVPINAAAQLSRSTFNRYYIRAICRLAERHNKLVEVYRARRSGHERSISHELEGQRMLPQVIETYFSEDPREHDPSLPFGPNSGLSVRVAD